MLSIEKERAQAQSFAIRAAILEEAEQPELAVIFHDLIALCDRKIELFKKLEERRERLSQAL